MSVRTRRFRIESNGRSIVFATPATNAGLAPFKPSVGLSGIMAVEVPLAVRHVHLRVTAYSSNEEHGFGRARQISLPMSALSVCVITPPTSSVPNGQAKPVAFYGIFYFLWARVADEKWHFNSHYPTQANRRLEWGTQHLLPVWQKLRCARWTQF